MSMLAQEFQTWGLCWQSHLNERTYLPGSKDSGTCKKYPLIYLSTPLRFTSGVKISPPLNPLLPIFLWKPIQLVKLSSSIPILQGWFQHWSSPLGGSPSCQGSKPSFQMMQNTTRFWPLEKIMVSLMMVFRGIFKGCMHLTSKFQVALSEAFFIDFPLFAWLDWTTKSVSISTSMVSTGFPNHCSWDTSLPCGTLLPMPFEQP